MSESSVTAPSAQRFVDLLGLRIERADARCVVRLTVDARHLQSNHVVHGSVLHAMLDTVMGIEAYFAAGGEERVATADISVRFFEAVPGGELVATARVRKVGRRLVVVDGEVHRGDVVVAVGQGSFARIRKPDPAVVR